MITLILFDKLILTFEILQPLCIECFRRTGQPNTLLNTEVPPSIDTVRTVCQTVSAISGNASSYDATATVTPLSPSGRPWMNSANSIWMRDVKGLMGVLWISSFIV